MTIEEAYREKLKRQNIVMDKVELYMIAHDNGDQTAINLRYSAMANEFKKYNKGANN